MRDEIMAVKDEIDTLKQESLAMEIVKDSKRTNTRMAITFGSVIIIMIMVYFVTVGLFLKYISDLGYEEITNTNKTQEIQDIDSIEGTNIINGDMYGKDKAE